MRNYSEAERTAVRAEKLKIKDFRSFESLELEGFERVNVICGENGTGKTNIIESIWLFTGGKSFRPAKDNDFIRYGQKKNELNLWFEAEGRKQEARIETDEKKHAWLNDIPLKSPIELAGNLCCVAFTPSHMEIVKGAPESRRRFMDTLLCQMSSEYIITLRRFKRILLQRNAALKQVFDGMMSGDELSPWNEAFIECAAKVAAAREELCRELYSCAKDCYSQLSGGKEQLGIRYCGGISGVAREEAVSTEKIKEQLLEELVRNHEREVRCKTTLVGPHRAEMQLTLAGKEAKLFGSQGQQRSCVLALKMAEAKLLEMKTGHIPIVLLDDVLSELDSRRRSVVLNSFENNQVFITCCDADRLNITEKVNTIAL